MKSGDGQPVRLLQTVVVPLPEAAALISFAAGSIPLISVPPIMAADPEIGATAPILIFPPEPDDED